MLSVGKLITTVEHRKMTQVTAPEVDQLEVEQTLVAKIKVAPDEGSVWEPGEIGRLERRSGDELVSKEGRKKSRMSQVVMIKSRMKVRFWQGICNPRPAEIFQVDIRTRTQ